MNILTEMDLLARKQAREARFDAMVLHHLLFTREKKLMVAFASEEEARKTVERLKEKLRLMVGES